MKEECFLIFLFLLLFLFGIFCIIEWSKSRERVDLWNYMLNITSGENIVNRTIILIVLGSDSKVYAIIPLITVLEETIGENNITYSIPVYIFPLNHSARGVMGCGWYDFNISKLLFNLEYEDYLNITNLGPRVFNLKYRSGEIRSNGIYHGDDIFGYIGLGPGKDFNSSEINRLSWLAMYLTIKNPKVFMEDGNVIVFPTTFRLKYVFIRSGVRWNALLFFQILERNDFINIRLHREGDVYYLDLFLKY